MARLFISYTREDGKSFADFLFTELQAYEPWLDRADLVAGEDWVREIVRALDESEVFLPILTPAYQRARFAPLELARAFRLGKRLIPLRFHPEADLGLFLEKTQYIDFCDPAKHEASLLALRASLDAPAADAAPVPVITHWDAVRARAERVTRRVISPALYDPRLYVRRDVAEEELARFLEGTASTLVVIGDSGVGKSSFLCHTALDLLEQGHAVLTYDCSSLADTEIEDEIARDLGTSAFGELDREAAGAERNLVLVFDSISDYRGSEHNGALVLLRRIHALVARLPGKNIRVILSCNTSAWDRLERLAPIRFDRERFHHRGDDPYLRLTTFTDKERDEAYLRYREAFDLESDLDALPVAVKERLREPVLLRMTAEAYRGVKQPLVAANLGVGIYQRYFDDRVSLPKETWLVDALAEQLLAKRTSALSMMDLARHEQLGPELLNEDPASTYSHLLDRGVLQEVRGDVRAGIVVKFLHTRVAAYALAANLLRRSQNISETAADLVKQASQFPLGWEVAKTLLLLARDDAPFLALAGSPDPEQRTLVVEALVELHAQDAKTACALLQKLLDERAEEPRRTALKAAYNIGPEARAFFLHAAIDGEPSMRESVKNTLYLIWRNESQSGRQAVTETLYLVWRHAPGFTYDLLTSLLDEIRLRNARKVPSVLEFILDLTITIYINHCEEQEVIDKTAELLHDLAVNRLRLHLFKTGLLGSAVEKVIFRSIARVFGGQVLDWMMFADDVPVLDFFRLPAASRERLSRIADYYDPASNLEAAHDDLVSMLRDEMPIFPGSAAMAIGVHACHDFARTEPFLLRLWAESGAAERRWLMFSFLVLLKSTPEEWIPFLEKLTREYLDHHRDQFLEPPTELARRLDLVLVPLGLAYGKRGTAMPLFEELLRDALAANDLHLTARLIAALNGVGFYYPSALFDVLRPAFEKLEDEQIASALVTTLATVRTLHFDAVDQFLHSMDAPEAFRRRIDAAADVALVHRFIRVLGYYNNGVHLTTYYPRMRRCFSAGSLRILATAKNPPQFVADYTLSAMRMLRDSKFRVKEWTLPE
jgi:hypothetical protein